MQVMLDDRRGRLLDLHLLVRGSHPQVRGAGQVRAAGPPADLLDPHEIVAELAGPAVVSREAM